MDKYFVCICGEILINDRTEKYQICLNVEENIGINVKFKRLKEHGKSKKRF